MILYVLVIAAWVPIAIGWTGHRRALAALTATALLLAAVVVRQLADVDVDSSVLGLFAAVLAVAGGSVVTTAVFELIDAHSSEASSESIEAAGEILRGGAWIGALERLAVFGSLAANLPSGVALVLAVKGLGRYPELRSGKRPAAAERFIIGTMVSVLWAALCAFVATGFVSTLEAFAA